MEEFQVLREKAVRSGFPAAQEVRLPAFPQASRGGSQVRPAGPEMAEAVTEVVTEAVAEAQVFR